MRPGIDLVATDEVRAAIAHHGARYLDRVYTRGEQDDCRRTDGTPDAGRLASRFAGKEACLKVLRPDDDALPWTAIEILRDAAGAFVVRFHGPAVDLLARSGLDTVVVSLTRRRGTAAAVAVGVVATARAGRGPDPGRSLDWRG